MNAAQAKDKISKLLALAQSDNPNEASAALLAARRLMARFKLEERDIKKDQPKEIRTVLYEGATYSGIRNNWFSGLANTIAKHHCCANIRNVHDIKSTVGRVGFVGLDDDPAIACTIFEYAVDHITRQGKQKKALLSSVYHDKIRLNQIVKDYIYNYAFGFIMGLEKQYKEQDSTENNDTSLVLVEPIEVKNYINTLKRVNLKNRAVAYDSDAQAKGYEAGYKFNPTPQIKE